MQQNAENTTVTFIHRDEFKPENQGLFIEYLFMFWLHRHLPAKQALDLKQSVKGYERIIRETLTRSGYFN